MITKLLCPGLLDTGPVSDTLMAVRDGMVNLYILKAPCGLVCIDTGWRPARVTRGFEELKLDIKDVKAVLLTHLHRDHARCLPLFEHAEIVVGEHERSPFFTRSPISTHHQTRAHDNQTLSSGGLAIRVVHTPGHTSGSVSYVVENSMLFTGDTLRLKHGKALPFLHGFNADEQGLKQSIKRLAGIEGLDCLLTSHNGISRDVKGAFDQWGQPHDGSLQGGALS